MVRFTFDIFVNLKKVPDSGFDIFFKTGKIHVWHLEFESGKEAEIINSVSLFYVLI